MRPFLRTFGEQNTVVRDHTDRIAEQPGETADERLAVQSLELIQFGAVYNARHRFANIVWNLQIGRNNAVKLVGFIQWCARRLSPDTRCFLPVQARHDPAYDGQRVRVVQR